MKAIDVIRLATDVGLHRTVIDFLLPGLVRLVNLAIEVEREACAKVCEGSPSHFDPYNCAEAVRARGEP